MGKSFIVLDNETANLNTRFGQPLQIAAAACDEHLNVTDSIDIRIRRKPWIPPNPVAMAVTRTWAPDLDRNPLTEYEAMHRFVEWATPFEPASYTYFNGFKFDEHVNRQAFYNTLLPPYRSSFQGNDRLDILHHMHGGWLFSNNDSFVYQHGKWPKFKLEYLCHINGIHLSNAHDALADTLALVRLAKLQKERDPELWEHFISLSSKRGAQQFIEFNPIFQWGNYHFRGGGYATGACVITHRGEHNFGPTGSGNYRRSSSEVVIANLAAFDEKWFDKTVDELTDMLRDDDRGRAFRVMKLNEQPLIWTLPEDYYGPATEKLRELSPWQTRQLTQRDARLRHLNYDILRERADRIHRDLDFCHRMSAAMERRFPEPSYKGERLLEDRIHDALSINFSEQEDAAIARVTQAFHRAAWPDKEGVAREFRTLFPRPVNGNTDEIAQKKFEHGLTLFRLATGIIYIQEGKDNQLYLSDSKMREMFNDFTRRRLTEPVYILDPRTGKPNGKIDRETGLPEMRYHTIDAAIAAGRKKLNELHANPPAAREGLSDTKRYLMGTMAYLETLRPPVETAPATPLPDAPKASSSGDTARPAPASASADPAPASPWHPPEGARPVVREVVPGKPHYRLKAG